MGYPKKGIADNSRRRNATGSKLGPILGLPDAEARAEFGPDRTTSRDGIARRVFRNFANFHRRAEGNPDEVRPRNSVQTRGTRRRRRPSSSVEIGPLPRSQAPKNVENGNPPWRRPGGRPARARPGEGAERRALQLSRISSPHHLSVESYAGSNLEIGDSTIETRRPTVTYVPLTISTGFGHESRTKSRIPTKLGGRVGHTAQKRHTEFGDDRMTSRDPVT